MTPTPKRVLIVDDDPGIATMLSRSLLRHGFVIETISSPEAALKAAQSTPYDAALLDLVMPGQDGLALAAALRDRIPGLRIALLTGYTHSPLLSAAERDGLSVFIKPAPIHEIVDFLRAEA